ncbi:MAG: hypothetical protein KF784_04605 [Fimbriimonadaceae bacterium]|nr:hypothetical protein [Fimbriimonadaceae bacterium]
MSNPQRHEPSSLDRFIWSKATAFWGYSGVNGTFLGFLIPGVIVSLIGLGLTLGGMLSTVKALMIPGLIQLTVGSVFLGISQMIRRRHRNVPQPEVSLTSDARALIQRLATHIGWNEWNSQQRNNSFRIDIFGMSFGGPRTSSDKLKPFTYGLLERSAAYYNRIQGMLKTKDSRSATLLQKHEPAVKAAADEAMIVSLNQAALMEKFPENSENCRKVIEARIRDLEELSKRLSNLVHSQMTVTEALASGSVMGSVLEQLRLDEAARQELGRAEEELGESIHQRLGE